MKSSIGLESRSLGDESLKNPGYSCIWDRKLHNVFSCAFCFKKALSSSRIDAFAYKPLFAEPFKGSELINRVYCYNHNGYYSGLKVLSALRRNKYDISITAFPSNKWHFNLFTFLVGAKKKLTHSYNFGKLRTLSFLQNYKVSAEEGLHDVEQNLNLLKLLDLNVPKEKKLFFHTGEENEKWADDFIKKNNLGKKHLIGVHSGSDH